jgi:hypothetical protein
MAQFRLVEQPLTVYSCLDQARTWSIGCGENWQLHSSRIRRHKFKVGQVVDYKPGRSGMPPSSWQYKIVRLLPFDGSDPLYRIKSAGETFERVAREQDLAGR